MRKWEREATTLGTRQAFQVIRLLTWRVQLIPVFKSSKLFVPCVFLVAIHLADSGTHDTMSSLYAHIQLCTYSHACSRNGNSLLPDDDDTRWWPATVSFYVAPCSTLYHFDSFFPSTTRFFPLALKPSSNPCYFYSVKYRHYDKHRKRYVPYPTHNRSCTVVDKIFQKCCQVTTYLP